MTLSKPPLTVTSKSGVLPSNANLTPFMSDVPSAMAGDTASIETGDRSFARIVDAQLASDSAHCQAMSQQAQRNEKELRMYNNVYVEGQQHHINSGVQGVVGGVLPIVGVNPYNPLAWQQHPLQGQQLAAGAPGPTPGKKLDSGKAPVAQGFIAYFRKAMEAVAKVSEYGAKKYAVAYSDQNWRRVEDAKNRYADALARHFAAYVAGESHDPESGLPHLDHVSWNANALIELREAQGGK